MLPYQNEFLTNDFVGVGICGKYIQHNDGIHVALFWSSEDQKKIIHFVSDNNILYQDIDDTYFREYAFNLIKDFPSSRLPSLTAICEVLSKNLLPKLTLSIDNVVYVDGKFDLIGDFIINSDLERNINCGIFVIALLNSCNYKLIKYDSWPLVSDINKRKYLEDWLNLNGITTDADKQKYYNYNRELRGKEVLAAPLTKSKPSEYTEVLPISMDLVDYLKPKVRI